MINFEFNTTNNITFPNNTRDVIVLINGEYYKIEIFKLCEFVNGVYGQPLDSLTINYTLFKQQIKQPIASATINFVDANDKASHNFLKILGFKEIPNEYFELENIEVNANFKCKGLGTALLNYIVNDIYKFNKLINKNLKIIIDKTNTPIASSLYKKFGARENVTKNHHCIHSTPLIIDNPMPIDNVPPEIAERFSYEEFCQHNNLSTKPLKK